VQDNDTESAPVERLLYPREVAEMFSVDRKTVHRWATESLIPGTCTPGGHWRFRPDEMRALLAVGRPHTSAFDHLLAEALRTADAVRVTVLERAEDRTPTRYRVNVYTSAHGFVTVEDADRAVALAEAMRQLKIAIGGAE
jgi:hypothetical protein